MKKIVLHFVFRSLLFLLPFASYCQTIPTYPISLVRGNNTFEGGGADSNNVYCKIVGVVYGQNIGTTGNRVQFTLRDATGGIGIFKDVNNLPIQLSQGDSVRVIGRVNHFNGLSQVTLDSVFRFATNRPLKTPSLVTGLGEDTESDLVKLEGFTLSNPSSWPANPTGSGFTVKIKRNSTELDLRIDNDCNLFGAPAPVGFINIVGIGGQFDGSVPRNSGYQLLPRNSDDVTSGLAPPLPTIGFTAKTLTIQETAGIVQIPLSLSQSSNEQLVVQVVATDSNASQNIDYTILQTGQVTFPANVTNNQTLSLNITNDFLTESPEKFKLIVRRISGGGVLTIGDSILQVTILDDDTVPPQPPDYSIEQIRGSNAFEGGVADSVNVVCKITGILYGPNLRGLNNGIQFTLRDITGGIGIFKDTSDFGLNLQEGDSVRAIGKVAHFNGLSQLNLDSIVVLATGRPLQDPVMVDSLDEFTESNLVRISGYEIVDPAQWTTGTGSGFTVKISNGIRTIDLRIDNDCELFNQPPPTETIDIITGLGGQFDSSIPRNSGYQLLPRKASDIELFVGNRPSKTAFPIRIFPNPTHGPVQLNWASENQDAVMTFELFNAQGVRLLSLSGKAADLNPLASEALSKACPGMYRALFNLEGKQYQENLMKN